MRKKASIYKYPYFAAMRSEESMELLAANKNALVLLYVIAWRARRTNEFNRHGLKIGEAFIGDYKEYGMTEREYRTAKAFLKKNGFATFNSTSKGTIATITNADIFDVNLEEGDDHSDELRTGDRHSNDAAGDRQPTTNKNGNNANNGENGKNGQEHTHRGEGVFVASVLGKDQPVAVNGSEVTASTQPLADATPTSAPATKIDKDWLFTPDDILHPCLLADWLTTVGYVPEKVTDLRQKFDDAERAELADYRGSPSDTPRLQQILAAGLNRIVCEGNSRYYDFNSHYDKDKCVCPRPSNEAAAVEWEKTNRTLLNENCQRTVKTSQGGSNENQPL